MLGYIKAYKPDLKIKDYEIYKGVYCSLCKNLGKRYTPLAQILLSYDFTFLALVKMSVSCVCPSFINNRCHYNPFIKCRTCRGENSDLNLCADAVVIMSYYKIKDNIIDGNFFKRVAMYFLLPAFSLMHHKAKRHSAELEKTIAKAMLDQKTIETSDKSNIDVAAEPTANALSKILSFGENDEQQIKVLERLGYLVGRWVYIIDAVDDLKDDIKHNNFNPLKDKYFEFKTNNIEEVFGGYARQVLNTTAGEAALAFELLETKRFRDILENILYDGLLSVGNTVLKTDGRCDLEKSL